jgi:hypothetical protein
MVQIFENEWKSKSFSKPILEFKLISITNLELSEPNCLKLTIDDV